MTTSDRDHDPLGISQKVFDSVPPRERALPERHQGESAWEWVARCASAAVEAALSKLASDEGYEIDAMPGTTRGWKVRGPDGKWVKVYVGGKQ